MWNPRLDVFVNKKHRLTVPSSLHGNHYSFANWSVCLIKGKNNNNTTLATVHVVSTRLPPSHLSELRHLRRTSSVYTKRDSRNKQKLLMDVQIKIYLATTSDSVVLWSLASPSTPPTSLIPSSHASSPSIPLHTFVCLYPMPYHHGHVPFLVAYSFSNSDFYEF